MGAMVGLVSNGVLARRGELPQDVRSAQGLLPLLSQMFKDEGAEPAELKWLALATGPGSFTGLRVAMTVAKMLALAGKVSVVGIDTFDILDRAFFNWLSANPLPQSRFQLWTVIDAQRGDFFVRSRSIQKDATGEWNLGTPDSIRIVPIREFAASLDPTDWVTGPGIEKLESLESQAASIQSPPRSVASVRLEELVEEALERVANQQWSDPLSLLPNYQRSSAAEEKRRGSEK